MSKKTPFIFLLLVVSIAILFTARLVWRKPAANHNDAKVAVQQYRELETYFENELITNAIAREGQPIEGFDAQTLTTTFPALRAEDFDGVKTLGGHYEVVENDARFVRNDIVPRTSAERTISSEGYVTLMINTAERFKIDIRDRASVVELIGRFSGKGGEVSKNDTVSFIETRLDESGSASGLKITPRTVLEDSRCPRHVTCIQAGTVRLRVTVVSGTGESTIELQLNGDAVTTEAEEIRLVEVEPTTVSTSLIKPSDYVFKFEIKKRSI